MNSTMSVPDLINETCTRALRDPGSVDVHRHALSVAGELWDRTRSDFQVVEFLLEFRIWARNRNL